MVLNILRKVREGRERKCGREEESLGGEKKRWERVGIREREEREREREEREVCI